MDPTLVTLSAGPREKLRLALQVNGEARELLVDPYKTLLEVLREDLGLTGTKHGCELGECGACAVLLDGELALSCLVAAVECQDRAVTTIEGLRDGPELHPLQAAFADHGAAQCGYCTPGMIVAAKWLLDRKPDASREEIADALAGQLCRCTGYLQIYEAVESAGRVMRGLPARPPVLAEVQAGKSHG
jgi:aerobic-type carbon monoxide dehydrogenase small subunit (CoxS/CutS family)